MSSLGNQRGAGTDERKARGQRAETLAAEYLLAQGYSILSANWRCRSGELDLIAEQDGGIVIIEVRSRSSHALSYGLPSESITPRKIRKVRATAAVYLQQSGKLTAPVRFDVITVLFQADAEPKLEHIEAAF